MTLEPLVAAPQLTGTAVSNGGAGTANLYITVGQTMNYGFEAMGLVTFDLGSLTADIEVVTAQLEVYHYDALGPVYESPMTELVAESVVVSSVYDLLDVSPEPETMVAQLSTAPGWGYRLADVTELVRRDLAQCRTRTQYRLRFAPDNLPGQSGGAEVKLFGSADDMAKPELAPRLLITYQAP